MIYDQQHGDQTCNTHNKGCNSAYYKGRHNINNWDEHDTIIFIIINNCLNNNVVFCVQYKIHHKKLGKS